jgi:hypothetical protein
MNPSTAASYICRCVVKVNDVRWHCMSSACCYSTFATGLAAGTAECFKVDNGTGTFGQLITSSVRRVTFDFKRRLQAAGLLGVC